MADGWRETADAWCCSVRSSMNMRYALIPDAEPAPYKKNSRGSSGKHMNLNLRRRQSLSIPPAVMLLSCYSSIRSVTQPIDCIFKSSSLRRDALLSASFRNSTASTVLTYFTSLRL